MTSNQETLTRFAALEGVVSAAELLDDQGRVVEDFASAVEARITKRSAKCAITIRVEFVSLALFPKLLAR